MNLAPALKLGCCASALIAVAGLVAPASADIVQTYNFYRITNNSSFQIGGQLSVDVHAPALTSTEAFFTFRNNMVGGIVASRVTEIYFDDGTPGSLSTISVTNFGVGSTTVPAFQTTRVSPGDLPGGNDIQASPFVTTAGFAADALNSRGLNEATDSVTIRFSLLTDPARTFADVLFALSLPGNDSNNWLRIGLHVTSIGGNDGNSDSYVNNTEQNRVTVIPLPPAAFAGLGSLAAVALVGLCRRRINASV